MNFVSFFVDNDGTVDDVNGCQSLLTDSQRKSLGEYLLRTLAPTAQEIARFEKSSFARRQTDAGLPVTPLKPSDIYFHVGLAWRYYEEDFCTPLDEPVKDEVLVVMCPKFWFDREHCVTDCHLQGYIERFLPEGMGEETDCQFSTEGWTAGDLRAELIRRGFVESEAFSAFSEAHDPFVS
jgi:hypothetical protein